MNERGSSRSEDVGVSIDLGRERRRGIGRAIGSIVSVDSVSVGSTRRTEMFDDRDVDAFVAVRAGIWAGATDLPCTIWKEFDLESVERLLALIPVEEQHGR